MLVTFAIIIIRNSASRVKEIFCSKSIFVCVLVH